MEWSMMLAVTRAEIRSVRRLARYWTFAILSVFASFGIYLYYAAIHGFLSRLSATIGVIGPRYLMSAMGLYIMLIFLLGLVFLAFDVRARDERERMAEVLDARPLSNVELLAGRSLGLILMALAPALLVALLYQVFGSLARVFGWYMGEPVEPYSLVGFLLFALAVFTAWCMVVVLLAVVVRNRLVVALAALGLIGVQLWGAFQLPIYMQAAVGVIFPDQNFPSDLVPTIATGVGLVRQAALFVLAAGLLLLAAALHPRRDGGATGRRLALGGAFVVTAVVMIGGVVWQVVSGHERRAEWRAAHDARRDDPRVDILAITGAVRIDPGSQVESDFEIRARAPESAPLSQVLFTFNPGFAVTRVAAAGAEAAWTHEAGLLEVSLATPLPPGGELVLEIAASGAPDLAFGYLDSARDILSNSGMDFNMALLGVDHGVFTRGYVALMPGQAWLPRAGTDVPSGDPRSHPDDHFDIDLDVEVPAGWLVAGPGRRAALDGTDGRARFRFNPGAPVTKVGLLASRFERRTMEVAGVEFELLVHPGHDRNLRLFADAVDEIADRVGTIFGDAARLGLPYPYGGLTLVESPTTLRGYSGGWRMDTAQTMPGVLLLRENSFTTSRFEFEFRNPRAYEDRDGGLARAKVEVLERFFENDFSGGNVFLGGSRNFLLFQTSARGEGAPAVNFVVEALVNQLLTGKQGYFSAFMFDSRLSAGGINPIIQDVVTGQASSIAEAVLTSAKDRPSVWDRALGASLADLEPTEDPEKALNVLVLKGHAIARSILDGLGREKTAAILAELLARHRGGHFTAEDLRQVSIDLGADLEPLIGDWLRETSLPGFMTSPVAVERLADDAQGNPRYQTRLHVYNGEPTPGLLRLRYAQQERGPASVSVSIGIGNVDVAATGGPGFDRTDPVRIGGHEAMEIGILSASPPQELWLQPYLSLNRMDAQLMLPRVDTETQVPAEPFLGSRPSPWRPAETDDIIVDDLDPGFAVEFDEEESGVRLGGGGLAAMFGPQLDMDQGLPEATDTTNPRTWSRGNSPRGWGKYRRTAAIVAAGSGDSRAVFTAHVPQTGRWRLASHLGSGFLQFLGTYDITLVAAGERRAIEFNGAVAEEGWNTLGEFDLPAGDVRVEISDASSGRFVAADAIRWQPVSR